MVQSFYVPFTSSNPDLVLAKLNSLEVYSIQENGLKLQHSVSLYDTIISCAVYRPEANHQCPGAYILLALTKSLQIYAMGFSGNRGICSLEKISITSSLPKASSIHIKVNQLLNLLVLHTHAGVLEIIKLSSSVAAQALEKNKESLAKITRSRNTHSIFQQRSIINTKISSVIQLETVNATRKNFYIVILTTLSMNSPSLDFYEFDSSSLKVLSNHSLTDLPNVIDFPNRFINLASNADPYSSGLLFCSGKNLVYLPLPNNAKKAIRNPDAGSGNLYELVTLTSSKYNIMQKTQTATKSTRLIISHLIIDSHNQTSEVNGLVTTYRVLSLSSDCTLYLSGVSISIPETLTTTRNSSYASDITIHLPIEISEWDEVELGRINYSDTLLHLDKNYFMVTSQVSNSVIFKINNTEPYISVVQYLGEFSNGPITDLGFSGSHPPFFEELFTSSNNNPSNGPLANKNISNALALLKKDATSQFKLLSNFTQTAIFSASGNLHSSEFKSYSRGLNTVVVNCFPAHQIAKKEEQSPLRNMWCFKVGSTSILLIEYFHNNRVLATLIVPNESSDTETVNERNKFDKKALEIDQIYEFVDLLEVSYHGLYLYFVTMQEIIAFEIELSKNENIYTNTNNKLVLVKQGHKPLQNLQKFAIKENYSFYCLCKAKETDQLYVRFINFVSNIDQTIPLPAMTIQHEISAFNCKIINNRLYLVLSDWEGNVAVLRQSSVKSNNDGDYESNLIFKIVQFKLATSAFTSLFLDTMALLQDKNSDSVNEQKLAENTEANSVLVGANINSQLAVIRLSTIFHSNNSSNNKGDILNLKRSDYLLYEFGKLTIELEKSNLISNKNNIVYYLKTNNDVYLLNLQLCCFKSLSKADHIVYDFGKLNVSGASSSSSLISSSLKGSSEFVYNGEIYFIEGSNQNGEFCIHKVLAIPQKALKGTKDKKEEHKEEDESDDDDDGDDKEIRKSHSSTRNKSRKVTSRSINDKFTTFDAHYSLTSDTSGSNSHSYQPLITFNTFINSILVDGIIRKFLIFAEFDLAVVITNKFPSSNNHNQSAYSNNDNDDDNSLAKAATVVSKLHLINTKSFSLLDTFFLPGYEAIDIIRTNYQLPKTSELNTAKFFEFEDKTSIDLQKMLLNKFMILTKCKKLTFLRNHEAFYGDRKRKSKIRVENEDSSDGQEIIISEFKLFAVDLDSSDGNHKVHHEMSYKTNSSSDYYSIANFGYRLILATGNRTGIFRLNYKPSSKQFYIRKSFEQKIALNFTSRVTSADNVVFLNDIFQGLLSFKISLIKYSSSRSLANEIYTVSDYAVANRYEDYEMPVEIGISDLEPISGNNNYNSGAPGVDVAAVSSSVCFSTDIGNNFYLSGKNVLLQDGNDVNNNNDDKMRELNIEKRSIRSRFNFQDNINLMRLLPIRAISKISDVVGTSLKDESALQQQQQQQQQDNQDVSSDMTTQLKNAQIDIKANMIPLTLAGSATGGIYNLTIVRSNELSSTLQFLQNKVLKIFQILETNSIKKPNMAENINDNVGHLLGFDSYRNVHNVGTSTSELGHFNFIDGTVFQKVLKLPENIQQAYLTFQELEFLQRVVFLSSLGFGL